MCCGVSQGWLRTPYGAVPPLRRLRACLGPLFAHVISQFARALSTRLSSDKDQGSIHRSQGREDERIRHERWCGVCVRIPLYSVQAVRWAAVGGETLKLVSPGQPYPMISVR